ncbi:MAG: xanthine dehydrogenase FAD-binding subunit XdhB [Anaerococcus sp.]|nr:xanthine dehydrogenase FAD-binding subunit XdhB [Anaerococcus sp.]
MYDIKAIYEAFSIDEAIKLKKDHKDAHFIAGGSDLLIKIREGRIKDAELISIYLVDELRGVSLLDDESLRIGGLTSFSKITSDRLIKERLKTLGEAVDTAGGPQLRNIATIGGNICNGVPSADSAPTVFAYDGIIELRGEDGLREVPVKDFYLGFGKVDLRDSELLTGVKFKKESYQGYLGHYYKYAMRKAMDIATSSVSVNVKFEGKNKIEDIRAAYGVASSVPIRVPKAEELFRGKELTEENMKLFAKEALKELSPRDSWRASKEVRRQVLYEITVRSLREILKNHQGGEDAQ